MYKHCLKALAAIGTIGAVITLVWATDKHYCTMTCHENFKVETAGMFDTMQRSMYVRDLRNQLFYWRQQVAYLRGLLRQYPNDPYLRQDLEFAMGEVNRLDRAIQSATSP